MPERPSDPQFLRRVSHQRIDPPAVTSGATAADLMTREPAVVTPDVTITAAVSVMLTRRISSLPVVEQERVVGIVTMTDVAMTLQCALQSLDKLSSELDRQGPEPQAAARTISTATSAPQHLAT